MTREQSQQEPVQAIPENLSYRIKLLLGSNSDSDVEHYLIRNGFFQLDEEGKHRFSVAVVDKGLDEQEKERIYQVQSDIIHPTGPSA